MTCTGFMYCMLTFPFYARHLTQVAKHAHSVSGEDCTSSTLAAQAPESTRSRHICCIDSSSDALGYAFMQIQAEQALQNITAAMEQASGHRQEAALLKKQLGHDQVLMQSSLLPAADAYHKHRWCLTGSRKVEDVPGVFSAGIHIDNILAQRNKCVIKYITCPRACPNCACP